MKNNLIFFIVDALSKEDIDFVNNNKDFPGFNKLIRKSKFFDNANCVAPVTEMVLPSIFTSKLPLNKYHYEYGLRENKNNLITALKKNLYHTKIFSSCSIFSELYGYFDSNNEVIANYSIEGPWKTFCKTYVVHLNKQSNNKFLEASYVKGIFERHYNFFIDFLKKDKDFFTLKISRLNNHSKKIIIKKIDEHLIEIKNDPISYLKKNAKKILSNSFTSFFFKKNICEKIFDNFEEFFKNKYSSISPSFLIPFIDCEIRSPSHENNAENLFNLINSSLKQNKSQPYAFFAHFMDIHDRNYSSNRIIKNRNNRKLKITGNHNNFEGVKKLSLKYFDNHLLNFLEINKKKLENTYVILTSDHGKVFSNHLSPLNNTKLSGSFHEDFLRIPFIIHKDNISYEKIEKIMSTIDIFPTILNLLELNSVNIKSLGEDIFIKERATVFAEHRFRGPSELNLKKGINYFCVKNNRFKYIYKTKLHEQDPVSSTEILIDLKKDPSEEINYFSNKEYSKNIQELKQQLKIRVKNLEQF